MVLTKTTVEVVWLWKLLTKRGFPQKDFTIIYSEFQNARALSEDAKYHSHNKHIDTQYQCFIREKILDKQIQI